MLPDIENVAYSYHKPYPGVWVIAGENCRAYGVFKFADFKLAVIVVKEHITEFVNKHIAAFGADYKIRFSRKLLNNCYIYTNPFGISLMICLTRFADDSAKF